ncbi:hypothetical protein Q7P37_003279 [Cladosporium fusiforme]
MTEQPKKPSEQQAAPDMDQQSGLAANQRASAGERPKSGTTNDQRNKNPESFERDGNVYTSNKATGRGKHALGNSGDVPKGPGNTYDKNTVSDDAQAFLGNMDAASVNAFFNGPPKEDQKKAHKKKKKDQKESEDDEED